MDELAVLIEDMDPEAEEKAAELKRLLVRTAGASLAAQLARQVCGFEFEDAEATLSRLRDELAKSV
jgi:hypothetical protein